MTAEDHQDGSGKPVKKRRGLWSRARHVFTGLALAGAMTLAYGAGVFQERWESYERQDSLRSSYESRLSRLLSENDSLESSLAASEQADKDGSLEERLSSAERVEDGPLSTVEYYPERNPPEAIDSLSLPAGSYALEIDKESQRARVWRRARYRLVADVPCSTGANPGEKKRSGDNRTPGGYAAIVSVQNSSHWEYAGERAYGPLFFRFNYGSWDGSGDYDPDGHCSLGAHGTNEEYLLGSRQSHGCTRLPNAFVQRAVGRGWLGAGTAMFVVPEDEAALQGSDAGLGYSRVRELTK
ncbi:L,D-transpeptidase [Candidatus Woesearchaeota archaeon]|nr:L,D-transpeptidase [Candidatus Woesearchaeota archaeon]